MLNKIIIRKSYLSKDPKTKKEGYYRDYLYINRFFNYFLGSIVFLWVGILVYILIYGSNFTFVYSGIIQAHIVFFILSLFFGMDAELIQTK